MDNLLKISQQNGLGEMYHQVKGLDLSMLLSGLTILVKGTTDYIHFNGLKDNTWEEFRLSYLDMMNTDRPFWIQVGPQLYHQFPDSWDVDDIVNNAANCIFNLRPLCHGQIDQEWLRGPGWYFFKFYSQKIKSDIIKGTDLDSLIPTITKPPKESEQTMPILELVEKLSNRSSFGPEFFYPVMLYLVLLLKETNFSTIK